MRKRNGMYQYFHYLPLAVYIPYTDVLAALIVTLGLRLHYRYPSRGSKEGILFDDTRFMLCEPGNYRAKPGHQHQVNVRLRSGGKDVYHLHET
jgi:hypothetical protein